MVGASALIGFYLVGVTNQKAQTQKRD